MRPGLRVFLGAALAMALTFTTALAMADERLYISTLSGSMPTASSSFFAAATLFFALKLPFMK